MVVETLRLQSPCLGAKSTISQGVRQGTEIMRGAEVEDTIDMMLKGAEENMMVIVEDVKGSKDKVDTLLLTIEIGLYDANE